MKNFVNAIRLMLPFIVIVLGVFGMTGGLSIVMGKTSDAIDIFSLGAIFLIAGFLVSLWTVSSVEAEKKKLSGNSE